MLAAMKRLDSLDGLRGLLAFYVLLGHMAPFAVLPDWIQQPLSHGGAAVDIFFVLSGLVITQSLLRAGGHAVPFLVARFARIFRYFSPCSRWRSWWRPGPRSEEHTSELQSRR